MNARRAVRGIGAWAVVGSALLAGLLPAQDAQAEYTALTGHLHGTEATARQFYHGCPETPERLGFVRVPLTVSDSGEYGAVSPYWEFGLDAYFAIYRDVFDPEDPRSNLVAAHDLMEWYWNDAPLYVSLESGTNYELIVSPWCIPEKGSWAIVFRGPGEVNSDYRVTELESFYQGRFDGTAPVMNAGCGNSEYHLSGPHRVTRSGSYVLSHVSRYLVGGVCVGIYDRVPNPSDPENGRIARLHDYYYQPFELQAETDYYIAVQPQFPGHQFDYYFVIAPRGDIYFDPTVSGAWSNPVTPGQGIFLDVLGRDNRIFLGWLTFDVELPDPLSTAVLGDPGHRWLTAFGRFDGPHADLQVEITGGGTFNRNEPKPGQRTEGTIQLELFDCRSGELSFDLGSAGQAGVIPIARLVGASALPCEALMQRTGTLRRITEQ